MAVTAKMVKELREMTGAGMMDCKKALTAVDGNMDEAVEFLRKKGLAGCREEGFQESQQKALLPLCSRGSRRAPQS